MNSIAEAVIDSEGNKHYYVGDKLHRLDGPAIEYASGTKEYYVGGILHRLDGPAIDFVNGRKRYYVDGKLQRLDGPAVEFPDGRKYYYIDDKLHRLDGPAIEYANGSKEYYVYDERHRLDGPAIELANGTKAYYVGGKHMTKTELVREQKRVVRDTVIALLPLELPPYVLLWILEFSHPYVVRFNQPELMRILYGLRDSRAAIISKADNEFQKSTNTLV